MAEPLLHVRGVIKDFETGGPPWRRRRLRAVDDVHLDVQPGETLGIVGESGSGKSTLLRIILGLIRPSAGSVWFEGRELGTLSRREMRRTRRRMQAVFQDTTSSLNPRQTVWRSVLAPLEVHGVGTRKSRVRQVTQTLDLVGLKSAFFDRYPHQLSGGQRQRVAIARAIILRPSLILADEPTSALDVSVQAQILNLFKQTKQELGLTYVFVSHNLGVIRYISDHVAVMYRGRIVEMGSSHEIFSHPRHDYTRALLRAVPEADPTRRRRDAALPA